jgi:hypothetical protein
MAKQMKAFARLARRSIVQMSLSDYEEAKGNAALPSDEIVRIDMEFLGEGMVRAFVLPRSTDRWPSMIGPKQKNSFSSHVYLQRCDPISEICLQTTLR